MRHDAGESGGPDLGWVEDWQGAAGGPLALSVFLQAKEQYVQYLENNDLFWTDFEISLGYRDGDIDAATLKVAQAAYYSQHVLRENEMIRFSGGPDLFSAVMQDMVANPTAFMAMYSVAGMGFGFTPPVRATDLTWTNTVNGGAVRTVSRGQYAGQRERPYIASALLVDEIMSAASPIPDPGGVPGALRWDVAGRFRGSDGYWELVVDVPNSQILHFNFTRSPR